jgi:DNA polymerase elongation subunit (family B)
VLEKDPDLFTAWWIDGYDFPKWKQRMDINRGRCLHTFSDISPLKSVLAHARPMRVKGRISFDLMKAFKQFTDAEMDSYSLGYVEESEELGIPKIPFIGTSGHCWDVAPDVAFKRNVNDVLIMLALDDKYGLIDLYDDLRTEFGALFHETFVRHRIIDTALMRLVNGKVVLKTTVYGKKPSEEKLLGAVVVAPKPDEYDNVFQFDFGKEYPSLIKGFNISPETYRDKDTGNCYHVVYDWIDDKTKVHKHFDAYFDKTQIGLLPELINFFFAKRKEYTIGMENAIKEGKSEGEIKRWERRQYNMKKTTNAIYGVMDYQGFRLNKSECTQATAILARISIEEEKRYLEEIGYTLLYGDTDSFFVCSNLKTTTFMFYNDVLYSCNNGQVKVVECQQELKSNLILVQKNIKNCMQGNGEKIQNTDYVLMRLEGNTINDIIKKNGNIVENDQISIEKNIESCYLNYLEQLVKSVGMDTQKYLNFITLMRLEQVKDKKGIIKKEIDDSLIEFIKSIKKTTQKSCCSVPIVMRLNIVKDLLLVEGKALQKRLNEHLTEFLVNKFGVEKAPAELGFKKIYSNIMFIAKKNYIGESIWDEKKGWKTELDVKGVSSVRSDASMLEKSTIKEIGKLCVTKASKEVIDNFVAIVLKEFDNRKYGLIEISYPAQIKKELKENDKGEWVTGYKTTLPAHIKSAIYSNMFLNTEFRDGDKPRRLSIKIPKKLKIKKGQQGLFVTIPDPYPIEFQCSGKLRKLSDISIVDGMMIPKWFQDHVDYERIKTRLEGKINKLLDIHYKIESEEK